jgi:hypothetical protein
MPNSHDPVEVYRARNLPEAHAIRLLLEREGILVTVANETLQGIVGEVAMGWSTSPILLVRQQDVEAARTLLANCQEQFGRPNNLRASSDDDALACLACGTLIGSGDVCPACGWRYEADTVD